MTDFTMSLSFPEKCTECGGEFVSAEPRVLLVVAGSAWKDGVAIIDDNGEAEMFRTASFHEGCAPPEDAAQ